MLETPQRHTANICIYIMIYIYVSIDTLNILHTNPHLICDIQKPQLPPSDKNQRKPNEHDVYTWVTLSFGSIWFEGRNQAGMSLH